MLESLSSIEVSLILFVSQIFFLGARTLNVIYTSKEEVFNTVLSGMFVSVFWLTSISLGVTSLLKSDYLPIVAWLIGGGVGTYYSFKVKKLFNRILKTKKKILKG